MSSHPGWKLIGAVCVLALVAGVTAVWLLTSSEWSSFASTRSGLTRQTIAVLPIQGAGPNPDPLFVEVHEAFISALGRIAPLRVIARTSVMRYEGSGKLIPEIGRELNADYIVETTASHDGDRVQMMTRLVRVKDDTPLWATTIERPLTDVLNMGGIALKIAGVMGVSVSPDARAALVDEYTPNSAAQAAFLEGRAQIWRENGKFSPAAEGLFERAVALDPKYARAYVSLSRSYHDSRGWEDDHEAASRAMAAARRAVELNDQLTEAHVQVAWLTFLFNRDWKRADSEFRRAVELNPSDFYVRFHFANFLSSQGELEESKRHVAVAHELSPFDPDAWGIDGLLHYYSREYEQAEVCYRRALEMAPFLGRYVGLARTLTEKRDCTAAVQAVELGLRATPAPLLVAELARAHAVCGRTAEARRILQEVEAAPKVPGVRALRPQHRAYAYAALGDKDRAFELLMQAVAEGQPDLQWAKVDPRLDSLRGDARFGAYLHALGFQE